MVQFFCDLGHSAVKGGLVFQKIFAAFGQQIFNLGFQDFVFQGALDEMKPLLNQLQLRGIKLFCLDQHFFAHADLAKIVQQAGIADFPHLIATEMNAGV